MHTSNLDLNHFFQIGEVARRQISLENMTREELLDILRNFHVIKNNINANQNLNQPANPPETNAKERSRQFCNNF